MMLFLMENHLFSFMIFNLNYSFIKCLFMKLLPLIITTLIIFINLIIFNTLIFIIFNSLIFITLIIFSTISNIDDN